MHTKSASAVFDSPAEAERAINELRAAGISNSAISVIANKDHAESLGGHDVEHGENATKDVVGKTAAGAGLGALLGIGALAIPGVGPLVAAGAIAEAAVGGAALTGTAIGAAAGGISGLLTDHGESEDDARYYQDHIGRGGIYISVDVSGTGSSAMEAGQILIRNGGHSASNARVA